MPPMERDEHEKLLTELFSGELTDDRKTEILQELRSDYGTVHEDFGKLTGDLESANGRIQHLVDSNNRLWREGGFQSPEKKEEDEQKEFSETISLEEIERNAIR